MENSSKIRCVAIDDEPLALEVIAKFCARLGGIDLKVFSNPHEGLEYIRREVPQIAFLDIAMDDVNGLDIASKLPPETCFIFTTAYMDYAVEGFNLDAVDYLHKPFAFARFETAFSRALRRLGVAMRAQQGGSITVKQEYNNVTIPLDEILYVEAMESYVKIFRTGGVCTISRMVLKTMESLLPDGDFIRIHRSFIVSRSKIKRFSKREIELINGVVLPIGRQYGPEVTGRLGG